jgi:hypothetical protein
MMIDSAVTSSVIVAAVSLIGIGVNSWIAWRNQSREWNRQRQWELKRDIVFESMRRIGKLESCLIDLLSFCESKVPDNDEFKEAKKRFLVCAEQFENTMFITELLVGEKLCSLLHNCVNKMRRIALQITDGKMPTSVILEASKQVLNEVKVVTLAARKELEIKNHDAIVAEN